MRWRLLARGAGSAAAVDLGLVDPAAQGLGADVELSGDAGHERPAAARPDRRLEDHPDGPFLQLGWVLPLDWLARSLVLFVCHDSMFLQPLESPSKSVRFRTLHA